ncbi:MAG: YraN family protein, partial [Moraxellaceae bacterium]
SSSPTHQQGALAEEHAVRFLQAQGYIVVAQNFHGAVGEIDIIAQKNNLLVFVEVRQRKAKSMVSAQESITAAKRRKIIKTAQGFLQQHSEYDDYDCRFDVMAYIGAPTLDTDQPEWIQAAFDAES